MVHCHKIVEVMILLLLASSCGYRVTVNTINKGVKKCSSNKGLRSFHGNTDWQHIEAECNNGAYFKIVTNRE